MCEAELLKVIAHRDPLEVLAYNGFEILEVRLLAITPIAVIDLPAPSRDTSAITCELCVPEPVRTERAISLSFVLSSKRHVAFSICEKLCPVNEFTTNISVATSPLAACRLNIVV